MDPSQFQLQAHLKCDLLSIYYHLARVSRPCEGVRKSLLRYPRSVGRWPDVRVDVFGLG